MRIWKSKLFCSIYIPRLAFVDGERDECDCLYENCGVHWDAGLHYPRGGLLDLMANVVEVVRWTNEGSHSD